LDKPVGIFLPRREAVCAIRHLCGHRLPARKSPDQHGGKLRRHGLPAIFAGVL
jgi:hypothetical protein